MSVAFNTLESLVDRQAVAFIGSVDAEGFPNMKAMLAPVSYTHLTLPTNSLV